MFIVLVVFLGLLLYYAVNQHVMLNKGLKELQDLQEEYVSIIEIVEIINA